MSRLNARPATLDPSQLESSPIPPDWILEGTPTARAFEFPGSPDGTCLSIHWDCTAGTFRWFFSVEEIVHILDGQVHIRDANGNEHTLGPGDVCVMPANTWMVWRVDRYVRKLAYCRFPVPRPFGAAVRIFQRAQAWLRLRFAAAPKQGAQPAAAQ